jgi:hypothetical protein
MKIRSVGKMGKSRAIWKKLKKDTLQGRVLYTPQDVQDAKFAEATLFEAGEIDENDTTLQDAGLEK